MPNSKVILDSVAHDYFKYDKNIKNITKGKNTKSSKKLIEKELEQQYRESLGPNKNIEITAPIISVSENAKNAIEKLKLQKALDEAYSEGPKEPWN